MGSFFKRKAFNSLLFFESLLFFYCYNLLPRQDFGLICCIDIPKSSATSIGPPLLLHPQHLCSCLKNTSSPATTKPQKRTIKTASRCQVPSRYQIERFTWITSFLDLKSTSITPLLIKMHPKLPSFENVLRQKKAPLFATQISLSY